jgi:hypothetical protein
MAAKNSRNSSNWIHRVLKGTHNHYSCYLPDKLGKLPSLILRLFYSGIKTTNDQIAVLQQIEDDAIVVYAFITAAIRKTISRIRKSVFIIKSIFGSRFPV